MATKPIALVVDEAQHALSTENGTNAMFALKSARDTMNIAGQPTQLALVFTRSNRDKLSNLTLDHKQPFYGVQVQKFPLLDWDFAKGFVEHYNKELSGAVLSVDAVFSAFSALAYRPEFLIIAVRTAISHFLESSGADLNECVISAAKEIKEKTENQLKADVSNLTPIQRAVFEVLIRNHANFTPFKDSTMEEYKKILGRPLGQSSIQAALESLRKKGLVWKEAFGGYVLENESYTVLFGLNDNQTF